MTLAAPPGRSHLLVRMLVLAVAAGALLRLVAARGDLWLEEVWAMGLAERAGSLAGVLALEDAANHPLVTAWLRVVGPGASPWLARLASVLAGAALVALGAAWTRERSPVERLASALLLAGSYLLVHYGSEARGYGPAATLAVGAVVALDAWLDGRRARHALLFAVLASLALLAHLTALLVVGACWAWAAVELALRRRERRAVPAHLALLGAPAPVAAWLVWLSARATDTLPARAVSGAPVREALRCALGLPSGPLEALAAVPLLLALLAAVRLARSRDTRVAFLAALATLTAAFLAWPRARPAGPRDLVVVAPFLLLLVAAGLDGLTNLGRKGLAAVAVLLSLFVAANALPVTGLLRLGRGAHGEALASMLATTAGPVTVGSDRDWATRLLLDDQARRLGATGRLEYLLPPRYGPDLPDWLILASDDPAAPAAPLVQARTGRSYLLVAYFPYAGLSGATWSLYRRAEPPAGP